MKIFRNIKEIFNSLYWYRWRKFGKLSSYKGLLYTAWAGDEHIFRIMIAKLEHTMWYIRNHGHESRRYIDSVDDVTSILTSEEKKYLVRKTIDETIDQSNRDFKNKGNRKLFSKYVNNIAHTKNDVRLPLCTIDVSTIDSITGKRTYYLTIPKKDFTERKNKILCYIDIKDAISEVPPNKVPKSERLYTSDNILDNNPKQLPYYKYKFTTAGQLIVENLDFDLASTRALKNGIFTNDIIGNLEDKIINTLQVIHLNGEDYGHFSNEVLSKARGAIISYHRMWQFRKDLVKVCNFDIFQNDEYYEEYTKVCADEKKLKRFQDDFKKERKEFILKTMEQLIDYGPDWWD